MDRTSADRSRRRLRPGVPPRVHGAAPRCEEAMVAILAVTDQRLLIALCRRPHPPTASSTTGCRSLAASAKRRPPTGSRSHVDGRRMIAVAALAVARYLAFGMPGMDHGGGPDGMASIDHPAMAVGADEFASRLASSDAFVVNVCTPDEGSIEGPRRRFPTTGSSVTIACPRIGTPRSCCAARQGGCPGRRRPR